MVEIVRIEGIEEVLTWDIDTLAVALHTKRISPVEVTKKILEHIKDKNEQINAYITVLDDHALAAAMQAEEEIMRGEIKGALHGVPIGLKDFIYTKNIRTTMGSQIYKEYLPTYDASVVTRLKEAGAIILGKLNTHEFAYGTTGDTSYFGPVRNPYDLARITGGSSSGSGAATAASMCYASLGTDTGGSIRIPSSFCGLVGMKPTVGRVSRSGVYPLCPTLDHIGPMTRTVKDNAIVLSVIAGYDPYDDCSVNKGSEDFTRKLNDGVKGCVIGIPTSFYFEKLDERIKVKMEQTIQVYKQLGADIRYIDIEGMENISQAFLTVLRSEAYATHKSNIENKSELLNLEVNARLQEGKNIKAHEYIQALEIKKQAIFQFNKILEEVDAILTPVTPISPPKLHERETMIEGSKKLVFSVLNKLTGPTNLTGLPSIAVPFSFDDPGLPTGFQLIGRAFGESELYRIAYAYEQTNSTKALN